MQRVRLRGLGFPGGLGIGAKEIFEKTKELGVEIDKEKLDELLVEWRETYPVFETKTNGSLRTYADEVPENEKDSRK